MNPKLLTRIPVKIFEPFGQVMFPNDGKYLTDEFDNYNVSLISRLFENTTFGYIVKSIFRKTYPDVFADIIKYGHFEPLANQFNFNLLQLVICQRLELEDVNPTEHFEAYYLFERFDSTTPSVLPDYLSKIYEEQEKILRRKASEYEKTLFENIKAKPAVKQKPL